MEKQIQHYLSRLIENPADRRPMYGLERVFGEQGDWSGLVEYLYSQAGDASDAELRARLLSQAAEIAAFRVGNAEVGAQLYQQALSEAVGGEIAVRSRLGLMGAQGDWKGVMELCRQLLDSAEEASLKADSLYWMGEIYRDQLNDKANAIKAFQAAFKADATLYRALDAARAIYAEAGKWDLVGQLYQLEAQQLQKERDLWRLSVTLTALAEVMHTHLGDRDRAVLYFQTALRCEPTNARALQGLRALGGEVPAEAVEEASLDEEAPAEAAAPPAEEEEAVEVELAEEEEIEADVVEVAAAAPPAPPARPIEVEEAVEVEVEAAAEVEAPAEAEAVEVEVEEAAEVEEDVEVEAAAEVEVEAVEVEVEAAEVEVEAAPEVEVAASAPEAAPAAEEAIEATWDERVTEMVALAEEYEGYEALDGLLQALALVLEHDPTHPLLAAVLDKALGSAPEFDGFYASMAGRMDGGAGIWAPLLSLFEKHAAAADAGASANLRRQAAQIKLFELGDQDGAAADAEALGDADLKQALGDYKVGEGGSWRRLQQELQSRYAAESKEGQAEAVYGRMAAISRGLGQADREIDALRHLVSDAPRVAWSRARLKRLYAQTDKWNAVVELLKEELGFIADSDVPAKVAHLQSMIQVYRDHLKLDVMVINTYNQILELDPANLAVLNALAEQYEAMRRYPDLIGVIQKMADLATTRAEKVALNLRVAHLFLEKFSNQAEAIKAFEAVLELDASHAEAIDFLKQMYERRRDWEKLIDVHIKEIDTLQTAEARGERYKEVAKLATERLRKPEVATDLWIKVLDFLPRDLDALQALEQLYERNKEWESLADISERKLVSLDDPAEKVKLAEKLGRLYGERLDAPEKAIAAWRTVLEHDPENRKGLDSLKRLLIDKQDWDGLESFYGGRGEDEQYVRILETLAGTVKEDDVKVELLSRSARVWRDKLGQTDRAVRALERVLSIDPRSAVAAGALEPIYEEAGDAKKLAGVLDILLAHLEGKGAQAEIRRVLNRLARLHENELRNPGEAFSCYARAFALSPVVEVSPETGAALVHEDTFEAIERVADTLGTWEQLVGAYQDRLDALEAAGDEPSAQELRLRIGRVLNAELGRAEDALRYYDAVLASAPDELRALSAEEEIFQKTGSWSALMDIYDRKLALTGDADERIAILLAKAIILEEQSEDYAGAVESYRAVCALAPGHLGALQALHRLYEALEQWEELAETVREEILLAQARPVAEVKGVDGQALDPEAAAQAGLLHDGADLGLLVGLKLALGRTLAGWMSGDDAEQEALATFSDVLAVAPDSDEALAYAEELGARGSMELAVANLLEPLYLERYAWEKLVSAREIQLAYLPQHDLQPRVEKLLSIGQILLDQIGDFERAFDAFGRALREDPSAEEARASLERIAEATEDFQPYVALLEDIVADLADPDLMHAYTTRIALGLETRLHDPARAQEAWRRVLDLQPDDAQALLHLESLYMEGQLWHELLEIYHRRLDLAAQRAASAAAVEGDPDAAADALEAQEQLLDIRFKMAMVHEEMLEDATSAIDIYRQIVEEHPDNLLAARAMDRLLVREGRYDELAENLNRQLELVEDPAERRQIQCRLAALMEAQLGQVADAIQVYASVLAEDPNQRDAIFALEDLIRREPDFRLAIVEVVEPLYEAHAAWERLIDVREIRIEEAQDPAERIALLHSVARLQEEQLSAPAAAFGTMSRALVEDVAHPETLSEIYRIAHETGLYAELVDVLEEQAQAALDLDLAADLNLRIAQLQEDQLGDIDGATDHYRRVIELRPEHLGAVENLERIYTSAQRWEDLVEILLMKVGLVEANEDRRHLLHHAATLYEEMLDQPDQAIDMYQRVLAFEEFDVTSIEALERLYLGASRWMDLIDLYNRKIRMAADAEERKQLYFVIGSVYESELLDADEAISTYRAILDLDAEDRQALASLDRLYESTSQWHELLEVLEREIALTGDPETMLSLKHRVGALWEQQLGDPVRAVEVYRQILDAAPDHEHTVHALAGMIERGEEPVMAAEVLEPIYRNAQLWEPLIAIYEILIASSEDPLRQAEILKEVGQIYELRLGNGMMAFAAFGRAMAANPDDEGVLDTLERLAGEQEAWEDLVALMEEQLMSMSDYDAVRRVGLRIGRILEEELFDMGRAIDRYRAVLDVDPSSQDAVLALDRLYEREGRWHDLAEILQQEIVQAEEEDAQIALRFRLGKVYETALEDAEQAIRTYHDIILSRPEHPEALEALEQMFSAGWAPMQIGEILEPIYRERGQWERLVDVYMIQLEHKDLPDDRFAHLTQIAEIYQQQIGDRDRAFYTLGSALRERPGDLQVTEELNALAAEIGAWEDLVGIFNDAMEASYDPDEKKRLWWRMAEILDHKLAQHGEAEAAYLQVLEMDPIDEPALQALDRLYTHYGRWAELAEILVREIDLAYEEDVRIDLLYRLGILYEQQLNALDYAVQTYNRILELNPAHGEALAALESLYLIQEDWENLFSVYERQADLLTEDDNARAEVYGKMADLADQMLSRPIDAIELWGRVLDIHPEDLTALRSLAALFEREERPGDLVEVLEKQAVLVQDERERVSLLSRVGQLWQEHLYSEDNALDAWRRVLELDPDNLNGLYACRDLYRNLGQYEDQVGAIERIIMLAAVEPDELRELYIELGQLQGDMLGRIDEAIRAWQAVLEIEPANGLALDSLERLFTEQGNWEACVDILDQKVRVLEARGGDDALSEQIELQMRIAEMWERQIGNQQLAISAYEAVLDLQPENMDASRAVEALYIETGEFNKLVELYLIRREFIEDAFDRLDLMHRASRIYEEHLNNTEAAFLILLSGFLEAHQDEQTANELERLAGVTGQWEDLVTAYLNVLETIEDEREAQFLHKKVAKWLADELNALDRAAHHFNEALRINPEDTEAMADLERLYERTGQWQDLVRVIETRASLTPEYDLRIELFRRMGDLYELQLQDPAQAIRAFSEILMLDDTDLGALEALERIYEMNAQWNHLIDVLQRKAAVIFEGDTVVQIKHRIAQLWEGNVQDPEQAVEAYRDVLTIDQTHKPSMIALERLYGQLERWHDLLDIYDLQLSMAQDGQEQIDLYAKTANTYEVAFQDLDRAVEAYGKVLLVDPNHLGAITELERLFETMERWIELVETYERHIDATQDKRTRIDVYAAMGAVHRDRLHDVYRAIEAFQRSLEIDPRNPHALRELANLFELASDWESCLAAWDSLTQVTTDIAEGVAIHYKMGRIYEENLIAPDQAKERYRYCLELDPAYKPAMDSLRAMYEREGDWAGAILLLKQEVEYTVELHEKSALFSRIAAIYEHQLRDEVSAMAYYEQAYELEPDNMDAVEPLARIFFSERRWERAEPLLAKLVQHRGYDHGDPNLYLLYFNLARSEEELALTERAIQNYQQAYELNPSHLETLAGLGRMHYKANDFVRGFKILQSLAVHHGHNLQPQELVDIYYKCGEIKRQTGETHFAQQMYEKALEVDPYHVDTLARLVEMNEQIGEWSLVIEYKRRQLQRVQDNLERFSLLVEIGDIFREQLPNPQQAVMAYDEALQLQPDSMATLRKLLALYTGAQLWAEAVQTIVRITSVETDEARLATYFYTIGVISRDNLGDAAQSVDYFNRALDIDPMMLKAFEAIDRVLTVLKEWKELERSYRKQLHRIKDIPDNAELNNLKLLLWKNLGEIYRTRQNNYEAAIQSFRIASGMRPDDLGLHEILADLLERTGTNMDEAILEHKKLISMSPFRIASYRSLFNAYMKVGKYDEAWCMASALTFLQSAEKEEQEFYQRYLGQNLQAAKRPLNNEHWKILYHPEQDLLTSQIMALLGAHLRNYFAFDYKTWNIHKRKDLLDPNQQQPFCKIYLYATRTLGLTPLPLLYAKMDGSMMGMRNANLNPPAYLVGADMFQGRLDRELGFVIGKQVALGRPEHYLAGGFFPTANLKALFLAAMQLTNPALNLGSNEEFVRIIQEMQRLPPPILMEIQGAMSRFLKAGQNPNLSLWVQGVDHTSNRLGLLLSGDLMTAANAIKNEQASISKASAKDKIKELVVFAISDDYFRLRKELGLALGS